MEKIEYIITNKAHTEFLVETHAFYDPGFEAVSIEKAWAFKSPKDATEALLEYFDRRSSLDENIDDFEILQIKKTLDIIQTHNSYDYTKPIKWHYHLNYNSEKVQRDVIERYLKWFGLQHDFDWVETKRTTNFAYITIKFKN